MTAADRCALPALSLQVLTLARAGGRPLLHDPPSSSAGDDNDDAAALRSVRAFMAEHLLAWLATSPAPRHLHATLHALLLLGFRGGDAQPHLRISREVTAGLTALLSSPVYLELLLQGPGGQQLPALAAVLAELGLGSCLGSGDGGPLKDPQLSKLLWPRADAQRLLRAYGLGLCRTLGMSAPQTGGDVPRQPGLLPAGAVLGEPAAAMLTSDGSTVAEEEQPQGCGDGGLSSASDEGCCEQSLMSELDARIEAKSLLLLNLDFLNQQLPEDQRIEVRMDVHPKFLYIHCVSNDRVPTRYHLHYVTWFASSGHFWGPHSEPCDPLYPSPDL